MMKKLLFGLFVSFFLGMALFGSVKATEYDPSYPWYLTTLISTPRASSIACSPTLSHCMVLAYDDTPIIGKKIKGYFIQDPRSYWGTYTPPNFEISADYTGLDTYNPFMPYQFGVQYNSANGFYYFWYGANGATIYVYYPINNTISFIVTKNDGSSCPIVYGQGTANTGNVYYDSAGIKKYNMFTGADTATGSATCKPTCSEPIFEKAYVGEKSNGNFQIYFTMRYDFSGTKNIICQKNMTGFPAGFAGIHYELNDDIYYVMNGTVNVTDGIYKIHSTDFITYSGNTLYYPFNPAIDESILNSIGADSDVGVMYQQFRTCNSSYGGASCPQIDVSNVSYNYLYFQSVVINPVTLVISPVSTFVQASCIGLNYTTSGTTNGVGTLTLGVPCTSNITLSFTNTNLKPDVFTETINLPSNCDHLFIKTTYSQPYTFISHVTDFLTGAVIPNVTVQLGTAINLTDASGNAYFSNTFPFDSPTFVVSSFTGSPTCGQLLQTSGTSHPYFYSASKSEYTTVNINPLYLVNTTNQNAVSSIRTILAPNGINVQITAHTIDGFEVTPVTTSTNWSGAFFQSNLIQGTSYNPNQTSAGGLPVNILLFSNLSAFSLTVNMDFNNATQTEIKTITNETNDYCVNGFCVIDFILPYSFTTFPCALNNDCVGGTCIGNSFYDLQGCRAGTCSYIQTICPSCDTRVGCFNQGTTQQCTGDLDCNKTCLSSSSASYGYCSSAGLCVYKNINCNSNVNCINTTIPILSSNGTILGNYSAGICADHQVCFSQSITQALFQITKNYVQIGFIFNPLSVESLHKLYLDNRVSCTPTEASATQRHCISGVNVKIIEDGSTPESNDIVTQVGGTQNNWQFKVNPLNNAYYQFNDISYQCDLNCELDIKFCEFGCNGETGFCYQSAQTGGGVIGGQICNQSLFVPICSIANSIANTTTNQTLAQSYQAGGYGFVLLFLTPIFWLMIIVVGIMTAVSWVTGHMEIGMGSGILLLIGFTLVFPELLFLTIIMTVIAGYIVGRAVVKAVSG